MSNRNKAAEHHKLAHDHSIDSPLALRHLFDALHADPAFAPALFDVAHIFHTYKLRDAAISYAKRAVLHAPGERKVWQYFDYLINATSNFSGDSAIDIARDREISSFLNSGYSIERRRINSKMHDSCVLIRAHSKPEFAERMLEKGELYFSPTRVFREMSDENRKDPNENKPLVIDMIDGPLELDGNLVQLPLGGISVNGSGVEISNMVYSTGGDHNICCFSLVSRENVHEFLGKYEGGFGDKAVVVNNVRKFNDRVNESMCLQGRINIDGGLVTYVPENVIESLMNAVFDPFIKALRYQSEFEFRYTFQGDCPAKGYSVGPLSDVGVAVDASDLKSWLRQWFDVPPKSGNK